MQNIDMRRDVKTVRKKKQNIKQYIPMYILALPAMIYLLINNYLPLYGMKLAFTELDYSKGVFNGNFVGLKNFKFLFSNDSAWIMTRNTVLYNLLFIIFGTVFGLTMAILFNELKNKLAEKFYQSALLIPYTISMVIVSYLAFAFLSSETGFINHSILKPLGIAAVSWYMEPKFWPFILLFVQTWKGIGFGILMYMARIMTISEEFYEAAALDGATKWQQIKLITLPLLKPIIIIMLVMSIGSMFRSDFGLFYQIPMNSGALYNVTTTIDTYSFNALMKLGDVTMSSATGVYQSVVGFILVLLANAFVRKVDRENSLF